MERRDFVKCISSFMLFPQLNGWPERINGIEFNSLRKPIVMTSRYPNWDYRPERSTIIPIRGIPGQPPNHQIIRDQNDELNRFNIDVDVVQFNPNPDSTDLQRMNSVYLPTQKHRPFYLLYEHHFGTRFMWKIINGERRFVDLGNPRNRTVFFQDIELMFNNIIIPHQNHYLTFDGRAAIFMWATPVFRNAAPVFIEAKKRYPIFFIGGEDPYYFPKRPDAIKRVLALDAIMPYGTNRAGRYVGRYNQMIDDYIWYLFIWALKLKGYDALHIKLFSTVMFAFDHTRAPERRLPAFYPNSIDDVVRLCSILQSFMAVRGTGMYGKPDPGIHVVYDELFEGSAIEQSFPPHKGEPNWEIRTELSGLARLDVIKEYFGY